MSKRKIKSAEDRADALVKDVIELEQRYWKARAQQKQEEQIRLSADIEVKRIQLAELIG